MPINTETLPFINKMLMPASGKDAGEAIANFVGGATSGYEARQQVDQADTDAENHGFQNFVKAFNRAPGVAAEGAEPFGSLKKRMLEGQATQIENQNSIDGAHGKNLIDLGNAFGQANGSKQRWQVIGDNLALAASPGGSKVINHMIETATNLDKVESITLNGQIQSEKAKYFGNLAVQYPELDMTKEDDRTVAIQRQNELASKLPLYEISPDPKTGQFVPTYKREEDKLARVPVSEQEIDAQIEDEAAISASKGNVWTPQQRLERRSTLRMAKSFKPGPKGSLSINPDGTVAMSFGDESITVGAQTKIQTELASLQNSITQIRNSANNIREKDLGVAGALWETVANKWLSQIASGIGDPSVSGNRARLEKSVDTYLSVQQARGRMTSAERANMRDALVSRKLGESLPRAKEVLSTMGKIQQLEAVSIAKGGQQPLKDWMFKGLNTEDFITLYDSGTLTADEAAEWSFKMKQPQP